MVVVLTSNLLDISATVKPDSKESDEGPHLVARTLLAAPRVPLLLREFCATG